MESFQQTPILPSNAPPWPKLDEDCPTTQVLESYSQPRRIEDYLDDVSEDLTNVASCGQARLSYSQPTRMHSFAFDWLSSPVSHHKLSRKSERLSNYRRQDGTARMDMEEYQAEYKAEQNARLLASKFALCEGYKKYRNRQPDQKEKKGKDGVKWPDHIEDIFLRALCRWEPCGRGKKIPPGGTKLMGRNELIADYILVHTGEKRDRKQVSSHIQVIKPFVADEPMIMRYLATPGSSKASKARRLAQKGRSAYDSDSLPMHGITDHCSSQESAYSGTTKTYCSSEDNTLAYDLYADAGSHDNGLASPINLINLTGTYYNTSWTNNDILPVSTTALNLDLAILPLQNAQAYDFVGGNIDISLDDAEALDMELKTDPLSLAPQTTGTYDYTNIFSQGHSPVRQTEFPGLDGITDNLETPFQLQAFAGADSGTGSGHEHGELGGTFGQKDGNDSVFGDQHFIFHHEGHGFGDGEDTYAHSRQQDTFIYEEETQSLAFPQKQDGNFEALKSQDPFSLSSFQRNINPVHSQPNTQQSFEELYSQHSREKKYPQHNQKDFAESQDTFPLSQTQRHSIQQAQSQDPFLLPVSPIPPTHSQGVIQGGTQVFEEMEGSSIAGYPTRTSQDQAFCTYTENA